MPKSDNHLTLTSQSARDVPSRQSLSETRALLNHLDTLLDEYSHTAKNPVLLLALSGGVDSIVLLHLLVQLQQKRDFDLHAMHVHHGLSQFADDWAVFCQSSCRAVGVTYTTQRVNINQQDALGIEAAARVARYDALLSYQVAGAKPDLVLTAHHQHDQAETVLLQLARGAGAKGLAAMPIFDPEKRLLRPLLATTKQTLLKIAKAASLDWCEDDSNTNTDFDRNFIRHTVLPLLESRYPSVQEALARSAAHLASTQTLLDDLAAYDANLLVKDNSVCLAGLAQLSADRANNLVRFWLKNNQLQMPSRERLIEINRQLLTARVDAKITLPIQGLCIRRYQSRAYLTARKPNTPFSIKWRGEAERLLPNGDRLSFTRTQGKGLALPAACTELTVVSRSGGERFKPDANRPTRTLKHLLQENHIAPWLRNHLPLIYCGEALIYVAMIGEACAYQVNGDEIGLEITYQPALIE